MERALDQELEIGLHSQLPPESLAPPSPPRGLCPHLYNGGGEGGTDAEGTRQAVGDNSPNRDGWDCGGSCLRQRQVPTLSWEWAKVGVMAARGCLWGEGSRPLSLGTAFQFARLLVTHLSIQLQEMPASGSRFLKTHDSISYAT